jgi:hypothetical protein
MRKTYLAISGGSLLFSYLFYRQDQGLNYLIFTLFIVAANAFLRPNAARQWRWWLCASAAVYTSVCIVLYGSDLAIFANVISMLVLGSGVFSESALSWLVHGACSVGGSCIFITVKCIDFWQKRKTGDKRTLNRLKIYVLPLAIAILFFALYKSANPLFDRLTREIDIDMMRILFTLLGFLFVYGLIIHNRIEPLTQFERSQRRAVTEGDCVAQGKSESAAALILLTLLNILLVVITALDVNYLYLGKGLPAGITHKQFVHNGVGTLIFSILLGIIIILYFFRGSLNFEGKGRAVRWLAYAWLLQNLIMVLSTAFRNKMYIDEALLTYKRIGVYYWLGMAAVGLLSTVHKIAARKTWWYMFRLNTYTAFAVLVLSAGLDWDRFITRYNISHVPTLYSLDKRYLLSLSETNVKDLHELKGKPGFNADSVYHYYFQNWMPSSEALDYKLYRFLEKYSLDWRSYNCRSARVYRETNAILTETDSLNFLHYSRIDLRVLGSCSKLKDLKLAQLDSSAYRNLHLFPKLSKLSLFSMYEGELNRLGALRTLDTLVIYNTTDSITARVKRALPSLHLVHIKPKVY